MTDNATQESVVETRPLTAGQNAAIQLAFKEQQRLFLEEKRIHAQADEIGAEARAVMSRTVAAIKADLELDPSTEIRFEDVDGKLAVRWTKPPTGPSLVRP